jgi:hypothetical protein
MSKMTVGDAEKLAIRHVKLLLILKMLNSDVVLLKQVRGILKVYS